MSESEEKLRRKLSRLKLVLYILGGICIAAIFILGFTYDNEYDESTPFTPLMIVYFIIASIFVGHGKIIGQALNKTQPLAYIRKMLLLDWAMMIFGFIAFVFYMYSYSAPMTVEELHAHEIPSWLIPPEFLLPIRDYFVNIALTSLVLSIIFGTWLSRIYAREEFASTVESMAELNQLGKALSKKLSKRFRKKTINTAEDEEQEN